MSKIYDISPPLRKGVGVYPGDVPFTLISRKGESEEKEGLSALFSTLHLGAHVDAPCHVVEGDQGIGEVDLHYFLGLCQVMDIQTSPGLNIYPSQLKKVLAPRLLLKTGSFPDYNNWQEYAGLSSELIDSLHQSGVILIGVDTPSIDLLEREAVAHPRAISYRMAILEGLQLSNIEEGCYELIALPLPLMEADGSPVRAVLRPLCEEKE